MSYIGRSLKIAFTSVAILSRLMASDAAAQRPHVAANITITCGAWEQDPRDPALSPPLSAVEIVQGDATCTIGDALGNPIPDAPVITVACENTAGDGKPSGSGVTFEGDFAPDSHEEPLGDGYRAVICDFNARFLDTDGSVITGPVNEGCSGRVTANTTRFHLPTFREPRVAKAYGGCEGGYDNEEDHRAVEADPTQQLPAARSFVHLDIGPAFVFPEI